MTLSGRGRRQKGQRGERAWRDLMRVFGFDARRGQRNTGDGREIDVVCKDLPHHIEVKNVKQNLSLGTWLKQVDEDRDEGQPWLLAIKRDHKPWLVVMEAEEVLDLLGAQHLGGD